MKIWFRCDVWQFNVRDGRASTLISLSKSKERRSGEWDCQWGRGQERERDKAQWDKMRPDLCVKCKYFPNFTAACFSRLDMMTASTETQELTKVFVSHAIVLLTGTNFTNSNFYICWDTVMLGCGLLVFKLSDVNQQQLWHNVDLSQI